MILDRPIYIKALTALTGSDPEPDIQRHMPAVAARRMGRLLRRVMCTSLDTLADAGVTTPDAIITATANGCWANSERFLTDIEQGGEQLLKPTLFMQSTHNTPGSLLAIHLRCHGYNNTWSQAGDSFASALIDAAMLLSDDDGVHNVLLGSHDELTQLEADMLDDGRRLGELSMAALLTDICPDSQHVVIESITYDTVGIPDGTVDSTSWAGIIPDRSAADFALAYRMLTDGHITSATIARGHCCIRLKKSTQ